MRFFVHLARRLTLVALIVIVAVPDADAAKRRRNNKTTENGDPTTARITHTGPNSYEIANEFIRLSGIDGSFDNLEIDPLGGGNYSRNWIKGFRIGKYAGACPPDFSHIVDGTTVTLKRVPVVQLETRSIGGKTDAQPLWKDKRLGQRFVAYKPFTRIESSFPTWSSSDSGFTLTLFRNGPDGHIVAQKQFRNVGDDSVQGMDFDEQSTGTYFLQMSDSVGTPGWWCDKKLLSPDESGYLTTSMGDEAVPLTFLLRIVSRVTHSASWTVWLEDNKLLWTTSEATAPVCLIMPWTRDGYETDESKTLLKYFLDDGGLYRPVQQFKRRDSHEFNANEWLQMVTTRGFDVRFEFPKGGGLLAEMMPDEWLFEFRKPQGRIAFTTTSESLPDTFPEFFSSDPKLDPVLNQFLLSHGFNFGVGTFPDWKEWQTRILCWSKNPQKDLQAAHLLSYTMNDDGYVYSWAGQEGWPFPYKDDNKDGKNDYDTRHFTTNPSYIMGCTNHALWTRDKKFVERIMPRVRKAMEFMLDDLGGDRGLLIIKAPGHEGRTGGIGSNYWDILPFGYKDAYTNIYFYASLRDMAKLEKLAASMGIPAGMRGAEYYSKLADKVREEYQNAFWDDKTGRFIGCIDADGRKHDYGFTFLNTEAITYGLAKDTQVKRVFDWMEKEPTASGQPDTFTRWKFAPRSCTRWNPPRGIYNMKGDMKPDKPSWWHFGWRGTPYDDQCQAGGAILYTAYYELMARAEYLGVENAWQRFRTILTRYALPDHLSGGDPLYTGESTQSGDGGTAGVEGEFPESGLVPSAFLYAFLGIEPDVDALTITPQLPKELKFAGVRNLSYDGKTYEIRVTNDSVKVRCTDPGSDFEADETIAPGETFRFRAKDKDK